MVIDISFVSKGGRDLRCEWSLQCVTSLEGNLVFSVFCPSDRLENTFHAFFMMKKGSGQHRELEELKKKFKMLINAICCV
ncbi:unnamed protein product [Staurois parvus]|uniref:Uncharacterized protein n=1 Tax=Staurois parvus TaxID=386267 RepID=A0ABN9B2S5_9NEOB|nr:unnamed protein product [Staurois parvus]